MTPLAKTLIHELRHNRYMRDNWDMSSWVENVNSPPSEQWGNVCGTVGCIAGSAMLLSGKWKAADLLTQERENERSGEFFVKTAAELLEIPFTQTATDLFIPSLCIDRTSKHTNPSYIETLLRAWDLPIDTAWDYLPTQARPRLETVNQMKAWANSYFDHSREIMYSNRVFEHATPDRAAYALERITRDEIPYCNWAEAFENA